MKVSCFKKHKNIKQKIANCLTKLQQQSRYFLVILLLIILSACSNDGFEDLQDFIDQTKLRKGRVEPLPVFKPVETFAYIEEDRKDPFAKWESEVQTARKRQGITSGLHPDIDRRKEILEGFPLDTLQMMGTLEIYETKWGLIRTPNGVIYRVKRNSYLGQNYGKVVRIDDTKLLIREIVPDGLGGWEERQASLKLADD